MLHFRAEGADATRRARRACRAGRRATSTRMSTRPATGHARDASSGRPAAPGFAPGRSSRSTARESAALADRRSSGRGIGAASLPLAAAAAQLVGLLARKQTDEAPSILGFQIALLEDDALAEPALTQRSRRARRPMRLARGARCARSPTMKSAEDDYFRARAADLATCATACSRHLAGDEQDPPIAARRHRAGDDLPPSRFLAIDWSRAARSFSRGSPTSHVAMLARARGVPMVVGLGMSDSPADGRGARRWPHRRRLSSIASPATQRVFEQPPRSADTASARQGGKAALDKPARDRRRRRASPS